MGGAVDAIGSLVSTGSHVGCPSSGCVITPGVVVVLLVVLGVCLLIGYLTKRRR